VKAMLDEEHPPIRESGQKVDMNSRMTVNTLEAIPVQNTLDLGGANG
jgi:hypothetical protein